MVDAVRSRYLVSDDLRRQPERSSSRLHVVVQQVELVGSEVWLPTLWQVEENDIEQAADSREFGHAFDKCVREQPVRFWAGFGCCWLGSRGSNVNNGSGSSKCGNSAVESLTPLGAVRKFGRTPLAGLAEFGPYSTTAWTATGQQVRVAILAPHDAMNPVRELLNGLRLHAEPRERKDYLPAFPGFVQVFRTSLVPADDPPREPLPADLDRRLTTRPVELLYRRATRALTNSAPRRVAGT
jgi:hypothetical protein